MSDSEDSTVQPSLQARYDAEILMLHYHVAVAVEMFQAAENPLEVAKYFVEALRRAKELEAKRRDFESTAYFRKEKEEK